MQRFRVRKKGEKFYLEEMEGGMVLTRYIMTRDQWVPLAQDMLAIACENVK